MMKITKIVALSAAVLASAGLAQADAAAEAEQFMNTMKIKSSMDQSVNQMLNMQIQQNPAMASYKPVMLEFFRKHMSYESMKPQLIKMYSDAFSAAELKEMNEFYASDVGQKAISKMPELMQKSAQMGFSRVQQNLPELQDMISKAAK